MKTYLLSAAVAFAAMAVAPSGAEAKYTFALVPKNMNNPFFDQARDGCKKAEAESKGEIECMYIGPGEHGGGDEQVQIVQDLVSKKVRRHRRVALERRGHGGRAASGEGSRHPGVDLGLRSPAREQGSPRRLCRHARTMRSASISPRSPCRSSPRAARSASSRAALRRPTTMSACRAFATRCRARQSAASPGDRSGRREWLDGARWLPALYG